MAEKNLITVNSTSQGVDVLGSNVLPQKTQPGGGDLTAIAVILDEIEHEVLGYAFTDQEGV